MSNTTAPSQAFDPEFDAVYVIDAQGTITEADGIYAPDVTLDPEADLSVSGEWRTLTGHTGQHSYSGGVMHASEQWGQWAVDALQAIAGDNGVTAFSVVEVRDEDGSLTDGDPIGWAVAYLTPTAPTEHGEYSDDEGTVGGDDQLSAAPGRRFVQQQVDGTYLVVTEYAYVIPGVQHSISDDFDPARDGFAVMNQTEYVHCRDLEDVGGTEVGGLGSIYTEVGEFTIFDEADALATAQNFIRTLPTPAAYEMGTW